MPCTHALWQVQEKTEISRIGYSEGFPQKLLLLDADVVGQIEFAPAEVSGYPIKGENVIVMNCIWVLRRAKGHSFGLQLLESMIESEENAAGFAIIALENHWSPWLKKEQMENLGFKSIDTITVKHRTKHVEECFQTHLTWLPRTKSAKPPTWGKRKLFEGE